MSFKNFVTVKNMYNFQMIFKKSSTEISFENYKKISNHSHMHLNMIQVQNLTLKTVWKFRKKFPRHLLWWNICEAAEVNGRAIWFLCAFRILTKWSSVARKRAKGSAVVEHSTDERTSGNWYQINASGMPIQSIALKPIAMLQANSVKSLER